MARQSLEASRGPGFVDIALRVVSGVLVVLLGLVVALALLPGSVIAAAVAAAAGCVASISMIGRPRKQVSLPQQTRRAVPELVDAETGLGNRQQLEKLLSREIARSERHGSRSTLTVFEVSTGRGKLEGTEPPPPSAPFVARILRAATRESDAVARLDEFRFAVVGTETPLDGARLVAERIRTLIGSRPFASAADGTPLYARAWSGSVEWRAEFTTPATYVAAAFADMEKTRPGYQFEQALFAGATSR
jgi:GGDEF domain-containing protein